MIGSDNFGFEGANHRDKLSKNYNIKIKESPAEMRCEDGDGKIREDQFLNIFSESTSTLQILSFN